MLVGRDKQIHFYGPNGFVNHVHHKLQAYLWNLVDREPGDLTFVVTEIGPSLATQTVRFRLKTAFAAEAIGAGRIDEGIVVKDTDFPGFNSGAEASHAMPGVRYRGTRSLQYLEDPARNIGASGRALAARPQAGGH